MNFKNQSLWFSWILRRLAHVYSRCWSMCSLSYRKVHANSSPVNLNTIAAIFSSFGIINAFKIYESKPTRPASLCKSNYSRYYYSMLSWLLFWHPINNMGITWASITTVHSSIGPYRENTSFKSLSVVRRLSPNTPKHLFGLGLSYRI